MNILIVNGHLNVGGVEKSLVDLLKSIDYSKHKVDLLLFEGYGELLSQLPPEVNLILCDLHPTYGAFLQSIKKSLRNKDISSIILKIIFTISGRFGVKFISLMRLLRITHKKYDCAIAYRVGICADYVGFAVNAKKKMMWWHHGEFDYDETTVFRWRETLKKIDTIVCVSAAAKNLIAPHFPENADNIVVIPNMINQQEIIGKSKEFHPYVNENDQILVSVGRMSSEKHMLDAVYAMDKLIRKGYVNIRWYLVGDGVQRPEIDREIYDRSLEDKVICVGSQSNPYPYIADADVFVHPSYIESQGLTVLEALALGKTSVVTRSLGIQEFIVDGKNAFIAEQSIDSLVEKIEFVLSHNEDALLDLQCQRKTVEQFSPEHIVKKVMNLIE